MWIRAAGAARNYVNTETGEVISRRKYDQTYGRLAQAGIKSNEAQAQINRAANEGEQLARPARGRKALSKTLAPEVREEFIEKRVEYKHQIEATAKVQKAITQAKNKARRRPKITDRLLKAGTMSKRVTTEITQPAIEKVIEEARSTHVVSYGVGVNGIHDITGQPLTIWYQTNRFKKMRDIQMDFTPSDFAGMMEQVSERSYFVPVSAFVHLAFGTEYVKRKKETSIRAKRKQAFGNAV